MTKEELQLWRDKQSGTITQEEFVAKWAELQTLPTPVSTSALAPKPRAEVPAGAFRRLPLNTKILLGIGVGIIGMLSVIAFLLFWHSPEQTGKRIAYEAEQAAKEAEAQAAIDREAKILVKDNDVVRLAMILLNMQTGYEKRIALDFIPTMEDVMKELDAARESAAEMDVDLNIRYPNLFSISLDSNKKKILVTQDVSKISAEVKRAMIIHYQNSREDGRLENKHGEKFSENDNTICMWFDYGHRDQRY